MTSLHCREVIKEIVKQLNWLDDLLNIKFYGFTENSMK